MKKTCSKCYHYKNGFCWKVHERTNSLKHRPKCKHFRTSAPVERIRDNYADYGLVETLVKLSTLRGRK